MMKEYSCYPKLLNYVEKDLMIEKKSDKKKQKLKLY